MKHLTIDEIIDFVSINKVDKDSLILAKKVNAHLMKCSVCREKIVAFQAVYDELVRIGKTERFCETVKGDMRHEKNHCNSIVEKIQVENNM